MAPGTSTLAKEEARVTTVPGGRQFTGEYWKARPTAAKERKKYTRLCPVEPSKQRSVNQLRLLRTCLKDRFDHWVLCN